LHSYFRRDDENWGTTPRDQWREKISYDLTHLRGNGATTLWTLKIHKAIVSFKESKESFIVPVIEISFCAGADRNNAKQKAGLRERGDDTFKILTKNMKNLEPKITISCYESVTLKRKV